MHSGIRPWHLRLSNNLIKISIIVFDILEPDKRPVAAVADYTEVRDVTRVEVREARDVSLTLMFDPDHGLSERIIAEQFTV